ncbi:LuxR C-terminal-related transcriptional regulator [Saccharopolyspora sp. CA-218241]|uniref:helix-turn-helix transcriptional regulator n=1 Tax=Saccharopolyspora sp. CA-218241 TaxID=3240027 RepID=UPI003D9627AB
MSDAVLHGRDRETAALRDVLDRVRGGAGGALVITGAAGSGRSALLELVRAESPCRAVRIGGVRAEREIPFAGLDRLLRAAGLAGPPALGGDRLVALLGARPLVCCVDDAAELDAASLDALGFAARRAAGGPFALLFAADPETADGPLAGVPGLPLGAVDEQACHRLLADRCGHRLDPVVAAELVARAGGNPLALVDAATALTAGQAAGLVPVPPLLPARSRYRRALRRALADAGPRARLLALTTAAEPGVDLDVLAAACDGLDELDAAERAGLVVVTGDRAHPPNALARACLRAAAPDPEVHRRLARATTGLRAEWHRVRAGDRPAEGVTEALVRTAERARRTGRHAVAAEAAGRAAALSTDPDVAAGLLLTAGRDALLDGRAGRARSLARRARPLIGSARTRGLADLVLGEAELLDGMPAAAHHQLHGALDRLLDTDRELALHALVLAGEASCVAGDYARYAEYAEDGARLRRRLAADGGEPPGTALVFEHLGGMAALFQGRHRQAVPALRRVLALVERAADPVRSILASQAAFALGDPLRAHELAHRAVVDARARGQIARLPWALVYLSLSALLLDRYDDAETSALDGLRLARAAGQRNCAIDHRALLALVAALRGDRAEAWDRLADAFGEGVASRGLGRPGAFGLWAMGCAELAAGRPADAMRRLRTPGNGANPVVRVLATPHYVEAAVHCGERDRASRSLRVFDEWASTTASPARLALSHRCHGLLAERAGDADERFHAAIELHRTSSTPVELAKTELLYATRLRRNREPRRARELLDEAWTIFREHGARGWAAKAGAELRATGVSTPEPRAPRRLELTPQQAAVCRLVAEGATNREIGERLHISHRTVDHHLRNIFTKLGLRSRVELTALLADTPA